MRERDVESLFEFDGVRVTTMKKPNIGIVTVPILKSGIIPLSNLIEIIYPLSNDLYLIGNNDYTFCKEDEKIHTYGIRHESGKNVITKVVKHIYAQLKISYILFRLRGRIDFYIFLFGEDRLILPMLTVKLLDKEAKVISALPDYTIKFAKDIPHRILKPLAHINRSLSNCIILYSPKLVKEWNLEKYRDKISIAHKHFIDFDKFKIKKQFDERENLVGYIGRLSEEKGVLNFVKAVPEILEGRCEIRFLIGGDGQLREEIEKNISKENLNDKVKLVGWISHDELPDYLNELKLVVLPSYTEGLPNVMLEAMACGTPVLATPVGAIPDIIKDGETGFVMENNLPECIAENVERVLNYPKLDKVVKNARELVEKEFTYEVAVERYRKIFESI